MLRNNARRRKIKEFLYIKEISIVIVIFVTSLVTKLLIVEPREKINLWIQKTRK